MKCPRREDSPVAASAFPGDDNYATRDCCSFCGSMNPDTLMTRLEEQTVELTPTDKNYKIYVKNAGGTPIEAIKFYFQHFSVEQRQRFVDLLNEKKLKLAFPGHFYTPPFFVSFK